jgi:hypothetical protein
MVLTAIQRDVCRLLAAARRRRGESYVAGGAALGEALRTARLSRDVDVFHDTVDAVAASWDEDRRLLDAAAYRVEPVRERPGFVEAVVSRGDASVAMQWTRDSAYRFFPLVEHDVFGLALHPFDLATNKVLALVGRAEVRDWVDVLACHEQLQPLGYLAWAACGKDPAFTPQGILSEAARASRYTDAELSSLAFDGGVPSAADLSRRWHAALGEARTVVAKLPPEHAGEAAIAADAQLFTGSLDALDRALSAGAIVFHRGRIGGAWPQPKA